MPYIKKSEREHIDKMVPRVDLLTAGELNYLISRIVFKWVTGLGISYSSCNVAVGVLECVKQEFYRRVVAPYEDKKKLENGDVFIVERPDGVKRVRPKPEFLAARKKELKERK